MKEASGRPSRKNTAERWLACCTAISFPHLTSQLPLGHQPLIQTHSRQSTPASLIISLAAFQCFILCANSGRENYTKYPGFHIISVHFSHSVVSNSLRHHVLQHARPPCPSPTSRVYSNSWPLSRWCHPTISSSVVPFSSCLQSFPASRTFSMSQFFASHGQSIGGRTDFFIDWFYLLAVQGTLKSLLQHHSSKSNSLVLRFLYGPTLTSIHDFWKNHNFDSTYVCLIIILLA